MFDAVMVSPIGNLGLQCQRGKLVSLQFLDPHVVPHPFAALTPTLKSIIKSIELYFSAPQQITLPYVLHGTPFQRKVWQMLKQIPLGETVTYGELARTIGTSARAIGGACCRNPLPLIIPCHRVVAANSLGGFCGYTAGSKLAIKQWLLSHEQPTEPYSNQFSVPSF